MSTRVSQTLDQTAPTGEPSSKKAWLTLTTDELVVSDDDEIDDTEDFDDSDYADYFLWVKVLESQN